MTPNEKLDLLLSEITGMKNEIQGMKSNMATKEDIASMATKEDIANMATRQDLKGLASKEDVNKVFHELMNTEKWVGKLETRIEGLAEKVDTILLKSDNTALLLKLVTELENRMSKLEKNLA